MLVRVTFSLACLVAAAMAADPEHPPAISINVLNTMVKRHLMGNVPSQVKHPRAASDLQDTANLTAGIVAGANTDAAAPVPFQVLNGLYVTPCQNLSDQVIDGTYPFSVFSVRKFDNPTGQTYGWHLQIIWYLSDASCKPSLSDRAALFDITGFVAYHGQNRVFPNAEKVSLKVSEGSFFFPKNQYQDKILDELNKYCPCGIPGGWEGGSKGNTVQSTSCNQKKIIDNKDAPGFCRLVAGEELFYNIQYTNARQDDYYTSESSWDETRGYSNKINMTYFNEILKQSGNNDPRECGYDSYVYCNANVTAAAKTCDTCENQLDEEGLECAGCTFREMPDDDAGEKGWTTCCPCMHYYAQKNEIQWMDSLNC